MVGHGGSSAGLYLADPTSLIPSHCASIAATSTVRVNKAGNVTAYWLCCKMYACESMWLSRSPHSTSEALGFNPLRADKVSMFTHTYPHKPLRKTKVTICNHQTDGPLMCGLMFDLVIHKFRKSMAIHDTECPC